MIVMKFNYQSTMHVVLVDINNVSLTAVGFTHFKTHLKKAMLHRQKKLSQKYNIKYKVNTTIKFMTIKLSLK